MMVFDHIGDAELQRMEREARQAAWYAPKVLPSPSGVRTYAIRSDEWMAIHAECQRRGLPVSTDDPDFRPQMTEDSP